LHSGKYGTYLAITAGLEHSSNIYYITGTFCFPFSVVLCGIYGWVGIIFFNNTPCQFPLTLVIITNTQELLFLVYGFLLYYCTHISTAQIAVLWGSHIS